MFRFENEMDKEVKEQFRGGKGEVKFTHIFKPGEFKGKSRLCAKLTVEPGASIGLHEHVNEEEIFYVIRGNGIAVDDGVTKEITAGDAILTLGGTSHSVENTGDEPLELVALILLY